MMDTDKRRIVSLVVIVAGLLLCENSLIAENSHRRLRQLARNIYASDLDTQKQQEAVEAITQMGPSIVPELIHLIKDADKDVRAGAIVALGIFPQAAKAAIPDLIKTLNEKDEGLKMVTASTLGSMGPAASAAVPHLINILKDTNLRKSGSSAIYYAAEALGEIGPDAKPAVPALKEIRNDRRVSSATQGEASLAIHLIERKDPDPRVRAEAARGLRGTLRPEVVAILNQLLHDPDESVREAAAEALDFTRVLELLDKVQGKDPNERVRALEALGNMGSAAKWGELIISKCLNDSNDQIRRAAADALMKIKTK